MPSIEPLTPDHLDAAAALLAARQRALRGSHPELPTAFEAADAHRPLLAALLGEPGSHGVIAFDGGRPAAFLLGFHRTQEIWGRAAWSPIHGSAADPTLGAAGGELLRDCYAAWSRHFVARGIFRHYVHAPVESHDEGAWFNTGFGRMQAHALRDLAPPASDDPPGLEIRDAAPDDLEAIMPLAPLIANQLLGAPAWAITLPEGFASHREDWADELANPSGPLLLAVESGRVIGLAGFGEAAPGPMVPDGAWELAIGMTLPEARGRGVQRALLRRGLALATAAGATHMETDWRTASLVTARSWTALGFVPSHHRLHRHVDERTAWATGAKD